MVASEGVLGSGEDVVTAKKNSKGDLKTIMMVVMVDNYDGSCGCSHNSCGRNHHDSDDDMLEIVYNVIN